MPTTPRIDRSGALGDRPPRMDAQRVIARRMVIGLPPDGLTPAWEKDFAQFPPAGVILFAARDFKDLEDARRLIARLRELARPRRLFVSLDEEGGLGVAARGHLVVPPNAATLARAADPETIRWIAGVTAHRLRALGFDWDFAPVADVHSEPDNPVIGPRAWGTTPAQVTANAGEWLAGFRDSGVAACLKHAPGHGDTRTDSHLALPVCEADAATLAAREFVPFASHPDADSLMTAHVVYPALDPGVPGTYSRAIVQGVLRERLGFRGVVITDALEMQGAAAGRTPAEAGLAALAAGCDLLLYAHWNEDVRRARYTMADAVVEGKIDRALFDATRPRLATFDAAHAEPTAEMLAMPLEDLTPRDWNRAWPRSSRRLKVEGHAPDAARVARGRGRRMEAWAPVRGVASRRGGAGRRCLAYRRRVRDRLASAAHAGAHRCVARACRDAADDPRRPAERSLPRSRPRGRASRERGGLHAAHAPGRRRATGRDPGVRLRAFRQ
jgi:beta-glucosidase-like glycosyl hydrolase